jgi:hypothetical protein
VVDEVLVRYVWLAPVLWAIVHLSDYYTSLFVGRLYAASANHTIVFEGGIELTPRFRQDIASLRLVSPRFLVALGLVLLALVLAWLVWVELLGLSLPFVFLAGGLILLEAAVHARHLRNLALFRRLRDSQQPSGRVVYPRWLSLEMSAVEFAAFALVYGLCFLLAGGWSVLGGAVFCGSVALRHWQWSRRERRTQVQTPEPNRL